MNPQKESLHPDTIDTLFNSVFPHMSNLVIFNLAYFCVGVRTYADFEFREVLCQELFRRGVLSAPRLHLDNVIVNKFTAKDMEHVDDKFARDQEGLTLEDEYVMLLTDRDRFEERNTPKRKRRAAKKVT